jgi:hypothetical protein
MTISLNYIYCCTAPLCGGSNVGTATNGTTGNALAFHPRRPKGGQEGGNTNVLRAAKVGGLYQIYVLLALIYCIGHYDSNQIQFLRLYYTHYMYMPFFYSGGEDQATHNHYDRKRQNVSTSN